MITLAGFMGLGTAISNNRLVEVQGYTRPPVAWAASDHDDTLPAIHGIQGPPHGTIRFCGVYDEQARGRCLYWFGLPETAVKEIPFAGLPYWPGENVRFFLSHRVYHAVHIAREGRRVDISIDAGNEIGTCCSNKTPVYAGVKLAIEEFSGRLIPHVVAVKAAADTPRRQHAGSA